MIPTIPAAVNTSLFHFCKLFKKATGFNFTEHVSRVRVEKSKTLLLNPNLRVSEIAFEAGFQSLTHFNRIFKNMVGQSPTNFRRRLPGMARPARERNSAHSNSVAASLPAELRDRYPSRPCPRTTPPR